TAIRDHLFDVGLGTIQRGFRGGTPASSGRGSVAGLVGCLLDRGVVAPRAGETGDSGTRRGKGDWPSRTRRNRLGRCSRRDGTDGDVSKDGVARDSYPYRGSFASGRNTPDRKSVV